MSQIPLRLVLFLNFTHTYLLKEESFFILMDLTQRWWWKQLYGLFSWNVHFCIFSPDSSRSHSHSHPTVTHSAVGPMYAMSKPITPHHQSSDGTAEKKKKKEDKDREKHEKDKVRRCSVFTLVLLEALSFFCLKLIFLYSSRPRGRPQQPIRCFVKSTGST